MVHKYYQKKEVKSLPIVPIYRQSPRAKITTKVLTSAVQGIIASFDGSNIGHYINITKKDYGLLLKSYTFPKTLLNMMKH